MRSLLVISLVRSWTTNIRPHGSPGGRGELDWVLKVLYHTNVDAPAGRRLDENRKTTRAFPFFAVYWNVTLSGANGACALVRPAARQARKLLMELHQDEDSAQRRVGGSSVS